MLTESKISYVEKNLRAPILSQVIRFNKIKLIETRSRKDVIKECCSDSGWGTGTEVGLYHT